MEKSTEDISMCEVLNQDEDDGHGNEWVDVREMAKKGLAQQCVLCSQGQSVFNQSYFKGLIST